MDNTPAQLDAIRELNAGRLLVVMGFLLVHVAAYGLFTGLQAELHAVLGIVGLCCYRQGERQKASARETLLASVNQSRLIA